MKYFVLSLFGVAIVGGIFLLGREERIQPAVISDTEIPTAAIHGHVLQLEVVRTLAEQARGLSGRESLAENTGMLFVYEKPVVPGFWMKDMNFPIDIIWIDESKKIVEITEDLSPETFPQTFSPRSPVQYVLEVNANWARGHGVSVGDEVIFYGVF